MEVSQLTGDSPNERWEHKLSIEHRDGQHSFMVDIIPPSPSDIDHERGAMGMRNMFSSRNSLSSSSSASSMNQSWGSVSHPRSSVVGIEIDDDHPPMNFGFGSSTHLDTSTTKPEEKFDTVKQQNDFVSSLGQHQQCDSQGDLEVVDQTGEPGPQQESDPVQFLVQDWWAQQGRSWDKGDTSGIGTEDGTAVYDISEDTSGGIEPAEHSAAGDAESCDRLRTPLAKGLRAIREQCRNGLALSPSRMDIPDLRTPIR